ncbi:MAG: hypothetical protein ABSG43_19195 [Solirubrobacteraceae bacterium]|jgi:hypothetical protein
MSANKTDPNRLADRFEREADELEEQSERLHARTASVREDWERKRADADVPGAPPRRGEEAQRPQSEQRTDGDEPRSDAGEP